MRTRDIARVVQTLPPQPGFAGEGHTAVQVVDASEFAINDPFILLMDDRVDMPDGEHVGAAHPHAGFEIATFILEGELRDRDEGTLFAGDVMWTTAGSGVVHNEDSEAVGPTRILQLWMTIPSEQRWSTPRFVHMPKDSAPLVPVPGVTARLYSGTSSNVVAKANTHLPLLMIDVELTPHSTFAQDIPASFNGFFYVVDGELTIGSKLVRKGQVAWLSEADLNSATTVIQLSTGGVTARAVLYAGERQNVPIVMHGPFVGETRADLMRVSGQYMRGEFPTVSQL